MWVRENLGKERRKLKWTDVSFRSVFSIPNFSWLKLVMMTSCTWCSSVPLVPHRLSLVTGPLSVPGPLPSVTGPLSISSPHTICHWHCFSVSHVLYHPSLLILLTDTLASVTGHSYSLPRTYNIYVIFL